MDTKKQDRREGVLKRLNTQLSSGVKPSEEGPITLTDDDKERIKKELKILTDRIGGMKKQRHKKTEEGDTPKKDRWVIDIHAIHLGYVKKSERRKNKGKSRKKMRKTRSVSFVKTVDDKPGLIQAYREGKMGVSPRSHSFRMRKLEEFSY